MRGALLSNFYQSPCTISNAFSKQDPISETERKSLQLANRGQLLLRDPNMESLKFESCAQQVMTCSMSTGSISDSSHL